MKIKLNTWKIQNLMKIKLIQFLILIFKEKLIEINHLINQQMKI